MQRARRTLLASVGTGTLALTAGCLEFVLGNGPLELEAARIAPTDDALSETGYDEDEAGYETIEETVQIGVERDVRASTWVGRYTKSTEIAGTSQEASTFAAVSIPNVEVAGRSVNPLGGMGNRQLLEEFLGGAGVDAGSLESEETVTLEMLSEDRDVERFRGATERAGQTVPLEIAVTSFTHEGDLLVVVGAHPERFEAEADNVETLMQSVEHPV